MTELAEAPNDQLDLCLRPSEIREFFGSIETLMLYIAPNQDLDVVSRSSLPSLFLPAHYYVTFAL